MKEREVSRKIDSMQSKLAEIRSVIYVMLFFVAVLFALVLGALVKTFYG